MQYHTSAFANTLKSQNIQKKALLWLDDNHTAESITAINGCLRANVTPVTLQSQLKTDEPITPTTLQTIINKVQPELILFSPNVTHNNLKSKDLLIQSFPELSQL